MSAPERKLSETLLDKARQDLTVYRALAGNSEIDDESLGFHAQQAVEKSLKAVLFANGASPERKHQIHDLGRLVQLLEENGIAEPPQAETLDELTIYAVGLRYDQLLDARAARSRRDGRIDRRRRRLG